MAMQIEMMSAGESEGPDLLITKASRAIRPTHNHEIALRSIRSMMACPITCQAPPKWNAGEITTLLVYNILFFLFSPATYYTIRLAYMILFLTPSDLCTSLYFHGSRLLIPHYFSTPLFFLLFTRLCFSPPSTSFTC